MVGKLRTPIGGAVPCALVLAATAPRGWTATRPLGQSGRIARWMVGLVIWLAVIASASALVASPYTLMLPGEIVDAAPLVRVTGDAEAPSALGIATVSTRPASWFDCLVALVHPARRCYRAPRSSDAADQVAQRSERSAFLTATLVALRTVGQDAVVSEGGLVVDASAGPALVLPGDVVLAVDGAPWRPGTVLASATGRRMTLDILRASERLRVTVEGTVGSQLPFGLRIQDCLLDVSSTVGVELDAHGFSGTSSALMFGLEIAHRLRPSPRVARERVTGTGRLAADGRVLPVSGVTQKVVAAEAAGFCLFLVPPDNAEEARRAASHIRVISVGTFDAALEATQENACGAG